MPKEPIDYMTGSNFQHVPWIVGLTDDEGAFKVGTTHLEGISVGRIHNLLSLYFQASAFFMDMKAVREFEAEFEKYGPLMFGLHDGQSEAPKINAQKVRNV